MFEDPNSNLEDLSQQDLFTSTPVEMGNAKKTSYVIQGGFPTGAQKLPMNEFYGALKVPDNLQASDFHEMLKETFASVKLVSGAKNSQDAQEKIESFVKIRFNNLESDHFKSLSQSVQKKIRLKEMWEYDEFVVWCNRRTQTVENKNQSGLIGNSIEEDELPSAQRSQRSSLPDLSKIDYRQENLDIRQENVSLRQENSSFRTENAKFRAENNNLRDDIKALNLEIERLKISNDKSKDEQFDTNCDLLSQIGNVQAATTSVEPILSIVNSLNESVVRLASSFKTLESNAAMNRVTKPEQSFAELLSDLPGKIHIYCDIAFQDFITKSKAGQFLETLKKSKEVVFITPQDNNLVSFASAVPKDLKTENQSAILIYKHGSSTGSFELDKAHVQTASTLGCLALKQIKKAYKEMSVITLCTTGSEKDVELAIMMEEGLSRETVADITLFLNNKDPVLGTVQAPLCPKIWSFLKAMEVNHKDLVISSGVRCPNCQLLCPAAKCLASVEANETTGSEENDVDDKAPEMKFQGSRKTPQGFQQAPKKKKETQPVCCFCGKLSENHEPANSYCTMPTSKCTICYPVLQNHYECAHTVKSREAKSVMCNRWGADFKFVNSVKNAFKKPSRK